MYNHHLYFAYWLVNVLVLYVLGRLFPSAIDLSNGRLLPLETAIYAGFWLTFIVWAMWDFIIVKKAKLEPEFVAFSYFLLVNALGIMVVAHFTRFTGLTVSTFWWGLLAAFLVNTLQRQTWKMLTKKYQA